MALRSAKRRAFALATIVLAFAASGGQAAAQGDRVETIVQDDALLLHGTDETIATGMERIRQLGFDRVRLTAGWSVIAPDPDAATPPEFDATDPAAYPVDNWRNLDRAVRMAHEHGLAPMIDIAFWAPRWATKEPAETADRMALEVDPTHFANFAEAIARRYSGSWTPPAPAPQSKPPQKSPDRTFLDELFGKPKPEPKPEPAGEGQEPKPLPAVDMFTVWNEPNHPGFLRPQWKQENGVWVPRSAEIYRDMVRLAYPRIKAAAPSARVLIGATAGMGSSTPNRSGVTPLRFLRALACVDEKLMPIATGTCAGYESLPGDGWSHHPYSLRTTPDVDPMDKDKAPVAAVSRLARTLRTLADRGRIDRAAAQVYLTEYGYETNAPDPNAPFSLEDQGKLLAWAEYIALQEPAVRSWPQFQLYDRPNAAPRPGMREFGDWHSGLFFNDGSPKPSAATYSTPVFSDCVKGRGARWAFVWGRLRGQGPKIAGEVELRGPDGQWRTARTFDRPTKRATVARTSSTHSGFALKRYIQHKPGFAYRLRWTTPDGPRVSDAATPSAGACRPAKAKTSRRGSRGKAAKRDKSRAASRRQARR